MFKKKYKKFAILIVDKIMGCLHVLVKYIAREKDERTWKEKFHFHG